MRIFPQLAPALLTLALTLSGPAIAESYKDRLQTAEALFEAGKLDEALRELQAVLDSRLTPDAFVRESLELKGMVHRKRQDWRSAADTYRELTARFGVDLEKTPKNEVPEPLLSYYYYLGQAYLEGAGLAGGKERAALAEESRSAFKVARRFGYRTSFVDTALRELDELTSPRKSKRSEGGMGAFVSLGYFTWEETFTYESASGTRSGLNFDARTPCIGGGLVVPTGRFELGVKGCVIYGTGSVTPERTSVDYDPSGIRTYGAFIGPSVHWRPQASAVSLGLHFPVGYRIAQLPVPEEDGARIEERNNFAFAFALELESRIGPFSITNRVGVSPTYAAPLWGLALSYAFGPGAEPKSETDQ